MLELKNKKYVRENKIDFERSNIHVADIDDLELYKRTFDAPTWIHFGAGNLFKGFHCVIAQRLIEQKLSNKGVIVVEPFDYEIIEKAYKPYDNLSLQVTMCADGDIKLHIISSITESIAADSTNKVAWERLKVIFTAPSLQIVTLSITEKGYDLKTIDGSFKTDILKEFDEGIVKPTSAMTKLTALLYERYKSNKTPIALVSTDNFSHNGDKLRAAVITVANEWKSRKHLDQEFIDYLSDDKKVSFPWSMIDKITPYPSQKVKQRLDKIGFTSTQIIKTSKNSFVAPFVNTEETQYLVIEDIFPNGRPALEKAGVYFCDKSTVDKVEKMKVCTCLNPLHSALAIFGCILGFTSISDEMKDEDLVKLISKIGYDEGMPVVVDPGIIKPLDFINEVISVRFPNPNIPDTPQRIATDTSQKLGIRFGETIKLYLKRSNLDINSLVFIPLTIAGWCRYLIGRDDNNNPLVLSPDPLMSYLQASLKDVKIGQPNSSDGKLVEILSNEKIFGVNLYKAKLGEKIEKYFKEMLVGNGAVRKTLKKYLGT
ncbi:MAG: mannitol dehydrogenase family protein [Endomicrobium sp.]|jgi:fructuronate reductase|nr:mannitol dehydrogenase family protein [Endomicrobium sp.]